MGAKTSLTGDFRPCILAVRTHNREEWMPRANRYLLPDHVCHVTHRCHDRSFLLRFARDRDGYRARLREACETSGVRILTYCITSNHVHLVTSTNDKAAIAGLMQRLEGDHARAYNRRKQLINAIVLAIADEKIRRRIIQLEQQQKQLDDSRS